MPRNIRLLAWFNFLTDFRPYGPIAILYFSQVSGSYALGMSIYSVVMLSQSLFEVPTGVFSDLIGRKKTVVCGAVASTLSLVFYAIGGAYPVLLVGAICEGLARAFYSGNNDALLHDTLAENGQRDAFQEFLGKTAAMYQVGLAISALLGGLIATVSFQLVMWVSVIPLALSLLVSLFFVEPKAYTRQPANPYAHLRKALRHMVHNRRLREVSAASILSFAIGESAWMMRSAFVETLWPVWGLGAAQMLANVTAASSFYFAGRLIRRFGELKLLLVGFFGDAVNLFALLVPTVLSPALMGLTSLTFGVNTVAIGGLLQRQFTDEQRATMASLNSFGGGMAFAIFSFLLGALADRIGATSALAFATLILALPMALFWRALNPQRKTPEVEGQAGVPPIPVER